MCESYNIQYGTNFISVMPTNLYGPNDNFDLETSHVLPALLRKMHEAKLNNTPKVEIWGSGKPRREFLYSEDMADACVFLLENRDFEDIIDSRSESGMTEDSSILKFDMNHSKLQTSHSTQQPRHSTQQPRHSAQQPRHSALDAESNQEIRNTHINIGTGKDISIKELAQTIKKIVNYKGELYFNDTKHDGTMVKLHALGWRHTVELEEGILRVYEWYMENNK
jgi:GDP-L-fucose synthase